ncbi:MAG: nitrate reductase molybdenum cofactor assembly chaperone [Geobacteraceae bacterium GWC2_58_44]|nr:MAG: nitrate reductase molybdenum cofactor assembly chaperone [Geobacteraceae bacterium GWC2_58_44]HBG04354.1 nitrate reductase molybdenum cofactor assembly chaperone [Geobacter sp.]
MSIHESYDGLARLLDYPQGKQGLLESYDSLAAFLSQSGLESPAAPFQALVRSSTLAELQEDYVAHFDFNPAAAPYLGHHLYGDNQKKGAYMISVKQEFGRHDFEPAENELPDHLAVLLSFLAHLARRGEHDFRRRFIEEMVMPGLDKLVASCAPRSASPWLTLVEAAGVLCSADCREVSPC